MDARKSSISRFLTVFLGCLFGYPDNAQTIGGSCLTSTACGPLSTSLESGALNANNGSTYDYCTVDDGAFMSQPLEPCIKCLSAQSDNSYLSNCKLLSLQPQFLRYVCKSPYDSSSGTKNDLCDFFYGYETFS